MNQIVFFGNSQFELVEKMQDWFTLQEHMKMWIIKYNDYFDNGKFTRIVYFKKIS
jgi:hypothetical protein